MDLASKIEAILFYKNEPLEIRALSKMLEVAEHEVSEAVAKLKENLAGRGLSLIENGGEVSLATSRESAELLEKITKEEISKDLGKASLETLSIVLYKGEVSRREIDYIRGVNSNFILRSLLMRGLVQRVENERDGRGFIYRPTLELLSYLGIESLSKLPDFDKVRQELEEIKEKNNVE